MKYAVLRWLTVSVLAACLLSQSASSEDFLKSGAPSGLPAVVPNVPHFSELVKRLVPAVVNISAESADVGEETENPLLRREGGTARSLGSGFIVHEDGFIVTNNHVIQKAGKIIVRLLDDKSEYTATVIGRDTRTDIALLKIDTSEKLKTVYLGNSDELEVGEWVIAVGNQFQLGHTVSAGIVSALARKVRSPNASPYDAYIQTDASINPGSSGGPLFNTKGQVIGVNTAIFSPGRGHFGGTGFNIGIGFAMPINIVRSVVMQLRERGRVTRGLLGVMIQQVDKDVAEILGLKTTDGALVSDVIPGSPAATAGFERKDIVVGYNTQKVRDFDDLPLLVAETKIGQTVTIEVIRAGQRKTLTATIAELKDQAMAEEEKPAEQADAIGLVVVPLTDPSSSGVTVKFVEPGSPAAKAGIERDDVVEELAGKGVPNIVAYRKIVDALTPGKPVFVLVRKDEGTRLLVLRAKAKVEAVTPTPVP